jgi:hypothetical protein
MEVGRRPLNCGSRGEGKGRNESKELKVVDGSVGKGS